MLIACVSDGDYVYVFVSALPRVGIPVMVWLFKCNSAKLLFLEFPQLKLRLWGGSLWSAGYAAALQVMLLAQKLKNISTDVKTVDAYSVSSR